MDSGGLDLSSDELSQTGDNENIFGLSSPQEIEIDVDQEENLRIMMQREEDVVDSKNKKIINDIMKETEFDLGDGRGLLIRLGGVEGWKKVNIEPSGRSVTSFKIKINIVKLSEEEDIEEETEGEDEEYGPKNQVGEIVCEWVVHRTSFEFKTLHHTLNSISKLYKKKKEYPPFCPSYVPPKTLLSRRKSKTSKKMKDVVVPFPPLTSFPSGLGEKVSMKKTEFLLKCKERLTFYLEELLEYYNSTELLEYWSTTNFSDPKRKERVRHLIDTIFGFIRIQECPCFYVFERRLERHVVPYFHFFEEKKKEKFTVKKRLNENEFRLMRVNTKLLQFLLPNNPTSCNNLQLDHPSRRRKLNSAVIGSSVIDNLTLLGLGNSEIGEWETTTRTKTQFMERELRRLETFKGNAFVVLSVPHNQVLICAILADYDKVYFFPVEEVKKFFEEVFTSTTNNNNNEKNNSNNEKEEEEEKEKEEQKGDEESPIKTKKIKTKTISRRKSTSPKTSPRTSPRSKSSPRRMTGNRRKSRRRSSFSDLFFDSNNFFFSEQLSSHPLSSFDILPQSYLKIWEEYSLVFPFHIFEHFQISFGRRSWNPIHIRELVQAQVVDCSFRGDDFEPIRIDLLQRVRSTIPDLPDLPNRAIPSGSTVPMGIPSSSQKKKQQQAEEKLKVDFLTPKRDCPEYVEFLTRDGKEISSILTNMKSDYNRRREALISRMKKWVKFKNTSYSIDNPKHEQLLEDLWKAVVPEIPYQRYHRNWVKYLGFQGKDPASDFRAMGLLGLKNMIYFSRSHNSTVRSLMVQQRPYPYSVAGIQVTQTLLLLVGMEINGTSSFNTKGSSNNNSNSHSHNSNPKFDPNRSPIFDFLVTNMKIFGDRVLEEFFCVVMKLVDRLFVDLKAGYLEFPKVMGSVVRKICHVFSSKNKNSYPTSFQRLEYILNVDEEYKNRKPANVSVIAQEVSSGKFVELEFKKKKE